MDPNKQKEQFSNAYLQAVAATAGYNICKPDVDDDSVDWGIGVRGGGGTIRSPKVDLQLKCTSGDILKGDHLAFALKVKNYDELRCDDYQVPRILVVVLVPDSVNDWLLQTEDSLAMRRCGYWVSLRGRGETTNTETVTIHLPKADVFSVDSLQGMLNRIGNGGLP